MGADVQWARGHAAMLAELHTMKLICCAKLLEPFMNAPLLRVMELCMRIVSCNSDVLHINGEPCRSHLFPLSQEDFMIYLHSEFGEFKL